MTAAAVTAALLLVCCVPLCSPPVTIARPRVHVALRSDPPIAARAIDAARKAAAELRALPRTYRDFYARQAAAAFVELFDE